MAEHQNSLSEAAGVGSAVSDLFKLKRAASFAKAVKGGVGGAAGAAIGMALGHKDEIKKSAVAITAALMLPVLFLTMLSRTYLRGFIGELRRIKQRHPDQ